MKLSIKNLGPLKDAELELGDITVLLGPPNSGKSYTLKSLYAQLVMLDETARDHIVRDVIKEMQIWEHVNYFIKTVAPRTLIAVVALHDHLTSENGERILDRLRDRVGVEEIDVKMEDDEIMVTLQDRETIDISDLANLFDEKLNSVLQELVPATEKTEIAIPEIFVPEMSSLLYEVFRTPIKKEIRSIDDRVGIRSILRMSLRLENEENIKILASMEIHLKLNSIVWDSIQKDIEMIFTEARLKSAEKKEIDLLLENLFKHKFSRTRLIRPFEWRVRTIFRDLSRSLSERN